ncbi:MAG: MBL fold metallo-hydrolase [Candidatus Lokiarchaeota archaeon]|nr:MBL fold metallo-hydrolase [Candidatus Lokiarchaeota archaeon]
MISQDKILRDGKLHIFILGSGGPMNNDVRVASSIGIVGGEEFIIIDVGPGSYRNVDVLRLPAAHLNAIFLTHFHSDHIGDLGEANMLSWVNGRDHPLEVYGPQGVERVVRGFETAYELDTGYRIAHHGKEILARENSRMIGKRISIEKPNERVLCFDKHGLKVYAFEVDHSPVSPAMGYRIEFENNTVVITGDTIKTDNLIKHCQGADILFSEAISYDMINNLIKGAKRMNLERFVKILKDIQNYHMEPVVAAELAKEANVKKLVIVHITPPLPNEKVESLYLRGVSDIFNGEIILGKDRMKLRLAPK